MNSLKTTDRSSVIIPFFNYGFYVKYFNFLISQFKKKNNVIRASKQKKKKNMKMRQKKMVGKYMRWTTKMGSVLTETLVNEYH